MAERKDRIGVELKELRALVENEARLSGNTLSNEIRIMISDSLRQRYRHRTLAQILNSWNLQHLTQETEIPEERLGEIVCEISPPTCGELVRISSVLPMTATELLEISTLKPTVRSEEIDKEEPQNNEKQTKTTKKRKSNAKEKEYVCAN